MTATSVAFFRNLNVGQRRSPSRDQLLDAFAAAGATDVLSHQSNGTVAFAAAGDPQPLADAVAERLSTVCDYADLAVVRPVAWLVDLDLDALPDGCELTLFDGPSPFPEPLPWDPGRGDVTVLAADHLHAIVLNHVEHRSNGTPVIEWRIGVGPRLEVSGPSSACSPASTGTERSPLPPRSERVHRVTMPRHVISTPHAPTSPLYSQGVRAGAYVFVSGTTGINPVTGSFAGDSIQAQTGQALTNCEAILRAGRASLDDVVEVGVLLADPADFAGMNEEYARWFPVDPPTRYAAKLGAEVPGLLVSLRMTAFTG